jgi:hypothetical protein
MCGLTLAEEGAKLRLVEIPDYRSAKSDSPEGQGRARTRWHAFHDDLPIDVIEDAFRTDHATSLDDLDADIRDEIAGDVLERSELIGFWIAWHQAGGFANLERGGWHRATIFRKLRRFRSTFGVHPDEKQFEWIRLDLRTAWSTDIRNRITINRGDTP